MARIVVWPDPVVRYLQITQCYYELSLATAGRLGSGLNWCTFATWASKQAGATIRGEDLKGLIEQRVGSGPETAYLVEAIERELARLGRRKDVRSGSDVLCHPAAAHAMQ